MIKSYIIIFIISLLIILSIKFRLLIYIKRFSGYLNKDNFHFPSRKEKKELVIAFCNENFTWVDDYAKEYDFITIYNKCNNNIKFKSKNIKIINSPNVGTCDHAYLSYIIERYNNLPPYIDFTKGSKKPKKSFYKCVSCDENYDEDFKNLMKFKLKNYKFSVRKNRNATKNSKFIPTNFKNMGEWINNQDFLSKELYQKSICNIVYGGSFGTTAEQIRRTPKKVWEMLIKQQKYPREEIDHYIERTWGVLLCKPKYKISIIVNVDNKNNLSKEWFEHYINQGIQHFYLINKNVELSDKFINKNVELSDKFINSYITNYFDIHSVNVNNLILKEYYKDIEVNNEWLFFVNLGDFINTTKNKTIEKYIENIGTEFQIIKVFDIFSSQEKKYTHRLLVKAMSLKNNVNKIII
jgi:hypothetical protein